MLARGAGDITLNYFRKQPETSTKSDGSYVTIADREAEAYLRKQINERFPDDGILGEEEGELEGRSGRRWILDPIDGTFAFVHGVPFYGVLIALEIEHEMSVGVINIPALGEIVSAAEGCGCFLNGEATRVSTTLNLEDALLLCTDFRAAAISWIWPSGRFSATHCKDEPHVGRLLWLRAGRHRASRCDAGSGDELVGLCSVVADHGRSRRHVY